MDFEAGAILLVYEVCVSFKWDFIEEALANDFKLR